MRITTTFVFAFALGGASLFAQSLKTTVPNGQKADMVGAAAEPAALQLIFSNLTNSATAAYSTGGGYDVAGALSGLGNEQFLALPFKPTANAHVEQLRAAIQYISGTNQVELSLYSDAGGVPGTPLSAPVTVTNLPTFPACCTLAVATLKKAVAVTAGTTYWVVAQEPATGPGSDFEGVWNFVSPEALPVAYNLGSGFVSTPAVIEQSAGAVYGTIP